MLLQTDLLTKVFPAHGTGERVHAEMNHHVPLQVPRFGEPPLAEMADIRPQAQVAMPVLPKVSPVLEALAADAAAERSVLVAGDGGGGGGGGGLPVAV